MDTFVSPDYPNKLNVSISLETKISYPWRLVPDLNNFDDLAGLVDPANLPHITTTSSNCTNLPGTVCTQYWNLDFISAEVTCFAKFSFVCHYFIVSGM